jgi:RNA polymerase sigma factor (sigma-70 family)
VLLREERVRRLAAALHVLPDRARQVVTLVKLEERGQAEVAEMFDISLSAVEKHLARALVHLRRFDLSTVLPAGPTEVLSYDARQER